MQSLQSKVELNNGINMPWFGLGVFQAESNGECRNAVKWALEVGYRSIDTAAIYKNEEDVGKGIAESGVPREEIFVTTKLWNADIRDQKEAEALNASLDRIGLDYVDLYLAHWPITGHIQRSWKEMEKLLASGRTKAIGVSNYLRPHLDELLEVAEVIPAVNQIEFHPKLVQPELLTFCAEKKIQVEAWSPLMQGKIFEIPLIKELAQKYGKAEAQIVLRWDLQHGVITIPKSTKQHRIIDNAKVFDFELSAEDMSRLDGLDEGYRVGPDPMNFDF